MRSSSQLDNYRQILKPIDDSSLTFKKPKRVIFSKKIEIYENISNKNDLATDLKMQTTDTNEFLKPLKSASKRVQTKGNVPIAILKKNPF